MDKRVPCQKVSGLFELQHFVFSFPADTEGSFIVERVVDMATAAARHLSRVADSSEDNGEGGGGEEGMRGRGREGGRGHCSRKVLLAKLFTLL